jgi:hypothetical protein
MTRFSHMPEQHLPPRTKAIDAFGTTPVRAPHLPHLLPDESDPMIADPFQSPRRPSYSRTVRQEWNGREWITVELLTQDGSPPLPKSNG